MATDRSKPGELVFRTENRERFYVPDPFRVGFPNDRLPVTRVFGARIDGKSSVPGPGDTVRFSQHAFTAAAGSTAEYYLRLNAARYIDDAPPGEDQIVDILADDLNPSGNNLLFIDYKNRAFSTFDAKAAIQGPNIAARYAPDDYSQINIGRIVLDGHLPGDRWQGFHGFADLPRIGPATLTSPEVWMVTVGTLDLVDGRLSEADLANFSPDIVRPTSTPTWAWLRAREVLMQGSVAPGALAGVTESAAIDAADVPMIHLWDFFKKARDIKSAEVGANADVDRFIEWVDAYRHLAEDGLTCDPTLDFVAHEYALVTPYTVLLRSWYRRELAGMTGLDALQASFGEDVRHPLFTLGTSAFVRPAYDPNIESMWNALVGAVASDPGAAPLWKDGTGPFGVQNPEVLVNQWALNPWAGDPRYADTQLFVDQNNPGCGSANFAGDMDGSLALRWGHLNMICLTPHFVQPPGAGFIDNAPDQFEGHLYMALRPDLLAGLNPSQSNNFVSRLKFPVYENQIPLAYPIRGTGDSLLPVGYKAILGSLQTFDRYDEALYEWNGSPSSFFPFVPHDKGAQILLLGELQDPPDARGKFLAASSSTEITRPFLPYQDRYATSEDFAQGNWRDFETDEGVLQATNVEHIVLSFTPAP